MGGARETTVGGLRIHESGGCVHFHDDKAGRKVEVPVATWAKAWETLKNKAPDKWEYDNALQNTVLRVSTSYDQLGKLDVRASVEKREVDMTSAAKALDKFTLAGA